MKRTKRCISFLLVVAMVVLAFQSFSVVKQVKASNSIENVAAGVTPVVSSDLNWVNIPGYGVSFTAASLTDSTSTDFDTISNYGYDYSSLEFANSDGEHYVILPLGEVNEISGVTLRTYGPYLGFPKDFSISVWTGKEWTQVANYQDFEKKQTVGREDISFSAIKGNAVRMDVTELYPTADGKYALQLSEMLVWGKEAEQTMDPVVMPAAAGILDTTNMTAVTNDTLDFFIQYGYVPATVLDGDLRPNALYYTSNDTYATSTAAQPYIEIDLADACKISSIDLYARIEASQLCGFPSKYRISAYTDNGWETIASGTNNGVFQAYEYSGQQGKFMRVATRQVECTKLRITAEELGVLPNGKYVFQLVEAKLSGVIASYTEINKSNMTATTNDKDPWLTNNGYTPDKVLNGDVKGYYYSSTDTYTSSTAAQPYIEIDLAGYYQLNRIDLFARYEGGRAIGFPKQCELQAYTEYGWETIATKTDDGTFRGSDSSGRYKSISIDDVVCNKLRITATELGVWESEGRYAFQLMEVKLYGEMATRVNVSTGATSIAQTIHSYKTPVNLTDGDLTTAYSSKTHEKAEETDSVRVVLDTPSKVESVRLYPYVVEEEGQEITYGFPSDFVISVWDGTQWKEVCTKTNYVPSDSETFQEFTFEPTECREVKLTVTKMSASDEGGYALLLNEMKVMGLSVSTEIGLSSRDVALNQKAWTNYDMGYEPVSVAHLTDGKNTFVSTKEVETSDTEIYIAIAFDKSYVIEHIQMGLRYEDGVNYGFPEEFTLSAWTENGWKDILVNPKCDLSGKQVDFWFDAIECNQIKLTATKLGLVPVNYQGYEYALQLCGMKVYGYDGTLELPTNIALNKPVSAGSLVADGAATVTAVNDGDAATYYSSVRTGETDRTEWIAIDLQETYEVCAVGISPRTIEEQILGFPQNFAVEAWDGEKWIEIASVTNSIPDDCKFISTEEVTTNAVRLRATKQGIAYANRPSVSALQLSEFEIYGLKADAQIAKCSDMENAQVSDIQVQAVAKAGSDTQMQAADVTYEKVVETGDNQHILFWIMALIAGAVMCGVCIFLRARGKRFRKGGLFTLLLLVFLFNFTGCGKKDHEHAWDEGVIHQEATCTDDGTVIYTCQECEEIRQEAILEKGHDWNEGTVLVAATCNTDGKKLVTCNTCKQEREEIILAVGHGWKESSVLKKATCTTNGKGVYRCSACDKTMEGVIAATGHTWNNGKVVKKPTCTENGEQKYTCKSCGITEVKGISKLGHTWDNGKITVAPTAEKTGWKTFTCTTCAQTASEIVRATTSTVDTVENMVDAIVAIPENTEARILQITDLQLIDAAQQRKEELTPEQAALWVMSNVDDLCYSIIDELIAETNPHLILITGDLVYGKFDDKGTTLQNFVSYMEGKGIPWAPIFGEHEAESRRGLNWQCELLENAKFCLFERGTVDGNGNYSVGIKRGKDIIRVFYMMDTNWSENAYDASTNGILKNQSGFTGNQVRWLARNLEKQNKLAGKTIPSTICYHMPSAEFIYAKDEGTNAFGKNDEILQVKQGEVFEAPIFNKQTFLQILKKNGTDSVFVGHHHENSFSSVYEGIRWTFGLKTSKYDTYDADMIGGTLIKIPAKGTSINVEHIYVD